MPRISQFRSGEDAAIVPFSLILLVIFFIVGGVAVDVSNAYQRRTHLQVAADAAAHAALLTRETGTVAEAKARAIEIARGSLPETSYGEIITDADIVFGDWDVAAQVFTPNPWSREAVLVETARLTARTNSEPTFFLNFAGLQEWNIRSQSVFMTYFPSCLREGFVGEGIVEVTSNNTYLNGFCIHSNTFVDVSQNNLFESGVVVSMPDKDDVSGPSSMFTQNAGLSEALRDSTYKLRILNRIDDIIAGVQDASSSYARSYINNGTVLNLSSSGVILNVQDVSPAERAGLQALPGGGLVGFVAGRIHKMTCPSSNQQFQVPSDTLLQKVVLITNCKVKFGANVALEDAIIVNTGTNAKSFNGASGVRLGKDDGCAFGGGAQLVTRGGVEFPANLQMFGGQILALGDVSFTANANGIEGASIVAGGRIDGTANSVMAYCADDGMEQNFEAAYFRLGH